MPFFPLFSRPRSQDINRRNRVRRSRRPRRSLEPLEHRLLLVAPADFSQDFNVQNSSQFGDANAVQSGDYFLGGGFDTGNQTIDATISPLGLTTGVRAGFDLAGKAGVDLGYYVNSGSVNADYSGAVHQGFSDPTNPALVQIAANVAALQSSFNTTSPSLGVSADLIAQFNASLNGSGYIAGAGVGDFGASFGANVDQELLSVNRNDDQQIRVLGQPVTDHLVASIPISETPPVDLDASATTQNNPLGVNVQFGTSVGEPGIGFGVPNGSAALYFPQVNLTGGNPQPDGGLSATTPDTMANELATLQYDVAPIVGSRTLQIGPVSVDWTTIGFSLGPTVYAHQDASTTPVNTLTYNFDHPVDAVLNGTDLGLVPAVTFTPGKDSLSLNVDGPITVTPTWNFTLNFQNRVALDVDFTGTFKVGELSVNLVGIDLPGLPSSLGGSIGPAYEQDFDLADLPAITLFNNTIPLVSKHVVLPSFEIGENIKPDLTVDHFSDDAQPGSLRYAINSADYLAESGQSPQNVIQLGAGTYSLDIPYDLVDSPQGGDLDVTSGDLTIQGAGAGQTFIDAGQIDRLLHVHPGAVLHLIGVTLTHGYAGPVGTDPGDGGAILNQGTLDLVDSTVTGNSALDGGGIFNDGGDVRVTASTISNNTVPGNNYVTNGGGGIDNVGGALSISDSDISGNSAGSGLGGGINNQYGTFNITDSTIANNQLAYNFGGGIANLGGTGTISGSVLSGNSAPYGGAAETLDGTMNVVNCTLEGNAATIGGGGGIENKGAGTLNVIGCTLTQNTADYSGGAIDSEIGGVTNITDSTLTGNSAGHVGGGIFNDGGTLNVERATIAGNVSAYDGGGVAQGPAKGGGALSLHNTIVAGNSAAAGGPDLLGVIVSLGYNLIGDPSGASGLLASDLTSVDPLLGPLEDNGGPTQTMALLPGSPAINAGDNTNAPANDQRGLPGMVGGVADIGAFEVQTVPTNTLLSTSVNPSVLNQPVTFDATVAATSGTAVPIGTVSFEDGGTTLDTETLDGTSGKVSFTTQSLTVGVHHIEAVYLPTGAFSSSTSNAIQQQVNAYGPPSQLVLTTGPTTTIAENVINGANGVVVAIEDAFGNVVANDTSTVTMSASGPGPFDGSSTTSVAANGGVATFDNLVLDTAGAYMLQAADASLTGTSQSFTVLPRIATWTGGAGTENENWSDPANWQDGIVPAARFTVIFPQGVTQQASNDDLPAGTTLKSIEIDDGGYTISGNALAISLSIVSDVPAGTSDTIENALALAAGSTMTVANATTSLILTGSTNDAGTISVAAGANLTLFGTLEILAGGSIVDLGGITIEPGANISDNDSVSIAAGGTLDVNGSLTEGAGGNLDISGGVTVEAGAILEDSTTIRVEHDALLDVFGALTIESTGALDLFGTGMIEPSAVYNPQGAVTIAAGAALSLRPPAALALAATEGTALTATVATFAAADAAGYSATINWGDGHTSLPSAVTISADPASAGLFDIIGSSTYAEEGTSTVTVTLDYQGATAAASGTATVSDPSVSATPTAISAVEGMASTLNLATFTDPGGAETAADYAATIVWGDGHTSAGTITGPGTNGVFDVSGTNTYAEEGTYAASVTITHDTAPPVTVAVTATVTDNVALLLLNPRGEASLSITGNGQVELTGDGAAAIVDSASAAAVRVTGNAKLTAAEIDVTGSPGITSSGNASLPSDVQSGVAAMADPFSGLSVQMPAISFAAVKAERDQTLTLEPGTYVGGIAVSGGASVTLLPGVYYFEGGGLSVSGGGSLSGQNVFIYNAPQDDDRDAISIAGHGVVKLTAPVSGPYQGLAVAQNPSSNAPITVSGGASLSVTGVIYAAGGSLSISGNAQVHVDGSALEGLSARVVVANLSVSGAGLLVVAAGQNAPLMAQDVNDVALAAVVAEWKSHPAPQWPFDISDTAFDEPPESGKDQNNSKSGSPSASRLNTRPSLSVASRSRTPIA